MVWTACLLPVVSLAVPAAAQTPELALLSENLLPNPGFEVVDPATGFARGWRGFSTTDWGDCEGEALLTSDDPHGGERCVCMRGVRVRYAVALDAIPVQPDKTYVLRGWVRTALRRSETAYLAASWSSETGWLALQSSRPARGVGSWRHVEVLLRPEERDAKATRLQVSARVESSLGAGQAWFDDLELCECEPPAPESVALAEQRRYRNLARELLIQQAAWRARTEVLAHRHADLAALVEERGQSFEALVRRHADDVSRREFLFQEEPSYETVEAQVLAQGTEIDGRLGELDADRDPRNAPFTELQAMAALKQALDADPALRRFYRWAQLAALRPPPRSPNARRAQDEPAPAESVAAERASGMLQPLVRTSLELARDVGVVEVTPEAAAPDGEPVSLHAQVLSASGRVVAEADIEEHGTIEVPAPRYWFPDCPYRYELVVTAYQGGRAIDQYRTPIAFRDIRCVETDVTATMRHAWGLPATDYSFVVSGQPFFPTGTLCGALRREFSTDVAELFDELWLDFQRTYGSSGSLLRGELSDALEARGKGFLLSLAPDYAGIRRYETAADGMEAYREQLDDALGSLHRPSVLALQAGNEAELAVWGASLPTYYGDELWHVFDETIRAVREEIKPQVPVTYVRATHYRTVAPVPREDFSGVNQYTGRYFGRVATIPTDLATLSQTAAREARPFAITEWNGPKYSWASGGVSGVTEEGSADYIYRYFDAMLRTPLVTLSTEFTLNWVAGPLEDLTSVPVAEGLATRNRLTWSKQKGCDWYPNLWPDALADTPARRAMRGFQSPWYFLRQTPGELVVLHVSERAEDAASLAAAAQALGKPAAPRTVGPDPDLATLDANVLLLGGLGDEQPACLRELERMGVLGETDAEFPAAGRFLIQERVNPHFPDRYLVAVTAADRAGMAAAVRKLLVSAAGLTEAVGRDASCRRAIALIDQGDTNWTTFARDALELPTRGVFRSGDDLRTELSRDEFLAPDGTRRTPHWDTAALVLAQARALSEEEFGLVTDLAAQGVNVVVSLAAYQADARLRELLGVTVGEGHELTEHIPVAPWAQKPLAVPDIGDARAEAITGLGGVARDSDRWRQSMTIRVLSADGWEPAASIGGAPVILRRGSWWVVGADLAAVARLHYDVTHRGVIHSTYDRDTACGLERLLRLVTNACACGLEPRPATMPELRCTLQTNQEGYDFGDTLTASVRVADLGGAPVTGALAGIGVVYDSEGFSARSVPERFAPAKEIEPGLYRLSLPLAREEYRHGDVILAAPPQATRYAGQRFLRLFVEASKPGYVPDSTAKTVRVGSESDWGARVRELAYLIRSSLVRAGLSVNDAEAFVEIEANLLAPPAVKAGDETPLVLTVTQVERDDGDDWMEGVALVLRPEDGGADTVLPLEPRKPVASARAPVVLADPDSALVVDSHTPARLTASWRPDTPGQYQVFLRYRYGDRYRKVEGLQREDPVGGLVLTVTE